ncbi:MAG: hypothetical protein QM704_08225 [Anaeromyxobacteraceae bacterium]
MNVAMGAVSLALAAAMFAGRTQRVSPGYGLWVAGNVGLALSQVVLALQGLAVPPASVVLSNVLVTARFILDTGGLERFTGREPRWMTHAAGLAAAAVISAVFTLVVPAPAVRAWTLTGLCTAWTFWALALVVRDVPRQLGAPSRLAAAAFGLEAFWSAVRMIHLAAAAGGDPAGPAETNWQGTFFVVFTALTVVTTVALISLHTRRVEVELAAARATLATLNGVVVSCPSCRRVRDGERWLDVAELARVRREEDPARALCPECSGKVYGRR